MIDPCAFCCLPQCPARITCVGSCSFVRGVQVDYSIAPRVRACFYVYSDVAFDTHYVDAQDKEISAADALKQVKETSPCSFSALTLRNVGRDLFSARRFFEVDVVECARCGRCVLGTET